MKKKNKKQPLISIIVPVLNEEESLQELSEMLLVAGKKIKPFEIFFVDDGSKDNSLKKIKELAKKHAQIHYISFKKNYGKSAAYMAGFEYSKGDIVVTLDADLQDSPKEIQKLLKQIKNGADLVVGWKQGRLNNEPAKTIPSKVFNYIKSRLFGLKIHDSNCGLKAMTREVADFFNLQGDQYRFIPELAHANGFYVTEEPIQHSKRKYGVSKYGPTRFITGLLDIFTVRFLTSFTSKPLHFFGSIALVMLLFGSGLEFYVLVRKLMGSTFQTHIAAIVIGVLLILIGTQLFAMGLVGEMLSNLNRSKVYRIKEKKIKSDEQ